MSGMPRAVDKARASGPDFVGIGVQKSGTTWLGEMLAQHPEILFVPQKEVSFFTRYYHRGYPWYERHFRDKGDRCAGEISVNYAYSPRPAMTFKEFYPKWNPRRKLFFWRRYPSARDELSLRYPSVKIFAIFRNPADRAWSHYWFWRNRKERIGKRTVPFERMFAADGRWIRLQGEYADLLEYWRVSFPSMALYRFESIEEDPAGLIRDIYRYLGVDTAFVPHTGRRKNQGRYPDMPRSTRRLLVESYVGQIERFAALTGWDLSRWLE